MTKFLNVSKLLSRVYLTFSNTALEFVVEFRVYKRKWQLNKGTFKQQVYLVIHMVQLPNLIFTHD